MIVVEQKYISFINGHYVSKIRNWYKALNDIAIHSYNIEFYFVDIRYVNVFNVELKNFEPNIFIEQCELQESTLKQKIESKTNEHHVILLVDLFDGYRHLDEPSIELFNFTKLIWKEQEH